MLLIRLIRIDLCTILYPCIRLGNLPVTAGVIVECSFGSLCSLPQIDPDCLLSEVVHLFVGLCTDVWRPCAASWTSFLSAFQCADMEKQTLTLPNKRDQTGFDATTVCFVEVCWGDLRCAVFVWHTLLQWPFSYCTLCVPTPHSDTFRKQQMPQWALQRWSRRTWLVCFVIGIDWGLGRRPCI